MSLGHAIVYDALREYNSVIAPDFVVHCWWYITIIICQCSARLTLPRVNAAWRCSQRRLAVLQWTVSQRSGVLEECYWPGRIYVSVHGGVRRKKLWKWVFLFVSVTTCLSFVYSCSLHRETFGCFAIAAATAKPCIWYQLLSCKVHCCRSCSLNNLIFFSFHQLFFHMDIQ